MFNNNNNNNNALPFRFLHELSKYIVVRPFVIVYIRWPGDALCVHETTKQHRWYSQFNSILNSILISTEIFLSAFGIIIIMNRTILALHSCKGIFDWYTTIVTNTQNVISLFVRFENDVCFVILPGAVCSAAYVWTKNCKYTNNLNCFNGYLKCCERLNCFDSTNNQHWRISLAAMPMQLYSIK